MCVFCACGFMAQKNLKCLQILKFGSSFAFMSKRNDFCDKIFNFGLEK